MKLGAVRSYSRAGVLIVMMLTLAGQAAHSAGDAVTTDNRYLDALKGDWEMAGTFLGKPVKYHAHGERVVGTGTRADTKMIMIFPYADGAFRDLFEFDAKTGTWSLVIESQGKDGSWSNFASYHLKRPG